MSRKFYSKILLFGEYTLLSGSSALAIPFNRFYGEWGNNPSNTELKDLYQYLITHNSILNLDLIKMSADLTQGKSFVSNIPRGYGLGSSGALCAGILTKYGTTPIDDLDALKKTFSLIESFYHGTSSGLDPMVSYLEEGLLISPSTGMKRLGQDILIKNETHSFFLLDSQESRETQTLIDAYKRLFENPSFNDSLNSKAIPTVDACIRHTVENKWVELNNSFRDLSHWQWTFLQGMIHNNVRKVWEDGLSNKDYNLKLCGAGGGGFYLGFGLKSAIAKIDNAILL